MSLRTRLIIAFLLLSVVPLTAVTLFSYRSSVQAFEAAAEREAAASATDVSHRMELITADLGRKMDRLFVANAAPAPPAVERGTGGTAAAEQPDPARVRDSVAPLLGETAALLDRVEFIPVATTPVVPATPASAATSAPGAAPAAPPPPRAEGAAPTPPAPPAIVVDIPKIVEEARRAGAATGLAVADAILAETLKGRIDEKGLQKRLEKAEKGLEQHFGQAAEQHLKAIAEAMSREAAARAPARKDLRLNVEGRNVAVDVRKDGKLLGKAHATLNLDRTLTMVLALARRDQGEIPFAIDRRGALYTPNPIDKPRLQSLQVEKSASAAAGGAPRRVGDWIVVARKDPSGILFGIARPIGESLREIRRASVRNLSLGLLVVGLAFIGIIPISHRMTQHLSTLTSGVRQIAGGDFRTRVPVRSRDEFGTLARAFNQMAQDLERQQTLVVEQERLRRELELSRLIQTEMLPRGPLRSGTAEIAGISIPAREVGGDFFNYFELPDGSLALLVGDVSGKGVSAALLMANVQATLRARMPHETDLAALADKLDRELDLNTPGPVYLTLFLGILDKAGRVLRYVNAGHNPQFVLRADGIEPLSSTGLPIALYAGHGYKEARVSLASGDFLFFYTDGLVETENEAGEMFGAERLQTILAAERTHGIDAVLQRVEHAATGFRGGAELFDDATMMALRIGD
jgi:serine phosphatase RsbU (regulator of sigma subunit)